MFGWFLWTPIANAVTCGDVLTADTTLDADLVCPAGPALTVGADGVTFDGAGHHVIVAGEGTTLVVSGFRGVTVRNVHLSGTEGMRLVGVDGFRSTGGSVRGTRTGVTVDDGRDVVFDGWAFDGVDGVALTIDRCDDCRVTGSSFVGAGAGIDVRGPHARLEVVGNDLSDVSGWAVSIRGGIDDRIVDNRFDGANGGLRLIDARDPEVGADNTFGTAGKRGLWVEDSVGVMLAGLSFAGFEGTAVTLRGCTDCGVMDNVLVGVGRGIVVVGSDRVDVAGNDLSGAGEGLVSVGSEIRVDGTNTFRDAMRTAIRVDDGWARLDGVVTTAGGVVATGAVIDARHPVACGQGLVVDGVTVAPATTPDADHDGILDPCDACDDPDRDGLCGAADPCVGVDPVDADGDRWCADTDCDDAVAATNPGAAEATCNGIDDDCAPETGDAPDADGDGFLACTDCDDHDPTAFPGAPETCDGRDDDCDRTVDNGLPSEAWFADVDGDSYGDDHPVFTCDGPPSGYVGNHADCDDTRASAHPGAAEVSGNGIDDDCNRYTDDEGAT